MNLEDWDKYIAPHLAGIRQDAGWITWYSRKIQERLSKLQVRPDFATEAEAKLTEAIPALEQALLSIKESRDAYRALVEGKQ